jgi:hypothetical protein
VKFRERFDFVGSPVLCPPVAVLEIRTVNMSVVISVENVGDGFRVSLAEQDHGWERIIRSVGIPTFRLRGPGHASGRWKTSTVEFGRLGPIANLAKALLVVRTRGSGTALHVFL